MSLHVTLKSIDDLRGMSADALEREADNLLVLHGHRECLQDAFDREVFRALYIPRNLNEPLVYKPPKVSARFSRDFGRVIDCKCVDCGRARSYLSGQRCQFCYRLKARVKFYEAQEGAIWLDSMTKGGFDENGIHCGITMPLTEWWSDNDMPAVPKRIARVAWNDKFEWN